MLFRQPARTLGGVAVPDGTQGELRREVDDSLIATVESVGGWFTYQMNGNPGPHYFTLTFAGETHRSSSQTTGASGPTLISLLPEIHKVWTDGYIDDVLGELAVSAAGLGMSVTVAPGIAIAQGIIYDQSEAATLSIQPSTSQGRIDRVVIEVVPPGQIEEGRARLLVLTGTPSGAPVAPALTQTTALWQIPLATVTVDASVLTIASNKITDQRTLSSIKIADGAITTAKLADDAVTGPKIASNSVGEPDLIDGAVTTAKLGDGSVTTAKLADGGVTTGKLAPSSVTTSALADGSVTGAKLHPSFIPRVRRADSDTDQNYNVGSNQVVTGVDVVCEAGTYMWMAWAWIRGTDTSSSPQPKGWLGIHLEGGEQAAEFFYYPGGFSGNGGSVQVLAEGTFTTVGTQTMDFDLILSVDQGIVTVLQRQIMVWVQRTA